MSDTRPARPAGPRVYSIAAHRGFADALVAGLLPRYRQADVGLARLTLLLPSRRVVRTVTEAFVRAAGGAGGLLLPRMAVVGDLDLDETLGPLLDPLGDGAEIAPAVDPVYRWLRLAALYAQVKGRDAPTGAFLLRQAHALGQTIDRLEVEGIGLAGLLQDRIAAIVGDQAAHWQAATRDLALVIAHWQAELAATGRLDPPARRNALFDRAATRWAAASPAWHQAHPIVAAGVTSASPALARLLRVVSELPGGSVVLPDLDLQLDDEVWDALGTAGRPDEPEDPPFGAGDAVTHPQYHLKLLLNRMGINRGEVRAWHRAGAGAAPPARSRAISSLFLPPSASARWVDMPAEQRRLAGVRLMQSARPDEEAQAIAVLIRQALEMPERRAALVTPDRGLAARVVAHLARWGIAADDSAGRPLPQTAAGRLLLLLAELIAQDAAPVPLLALLGHPLAAAGEGRADWLDQVRRLDLALRGPRPAPGLPPLREIAHARRLAAWWDTVEPLLAPLFALGAQAPLASQLDALVGAGEALCGEALWARADGRALAGFVEELGTAARAAGTMLRPRELATVLRDAMDRIAVRPPWGGHPRVAVYGLLEARMARADLIVCGGLVEGTWPGKSVLDALLPPAVLRALGVPGADFRVGLAAHDLAAALGAPEVVLSWAARDEGGPTIPSRFVLRVRAMLGDQTARHDEHEAVRLAREIDVGQPAPPYPQPAPMPAADQRRVAISVTGLDRLRSDPFQFYASAILRLRRLDERDAAPSAAWKGTAVHRVLQLWHEDGQQDGALAAIAAAELDAMSAHPLTRSLWRPRLLAALAWVEAEVARLGLEGRRVIASEADGEMHWRGVRVYGRADRIDRLADGSLAVVDYKTGGPPSARMVEQGFSLQLGLIGLIAAQDGIPGVSGEPERFEYWSLARDQDRKRVQPAFGYSCEPILDGNKRTGIPRADMLPQTARYLSDAINRWILGDEPFTARLNPDLGGYNDYDQLMRLDEWFTRAGAPQAAA